MSSPGRAQDGPLATSAGVGALVDALRAAGSPLAHETPALLDDRGLAHHHVRLGTSGVLARVPKQSQLGLKASAALAYEAACFERAAPSGHVPRLHGVLQPTPGLPRGALLVEEVIGRPARLPDDLGAIVRALAALHSLALPAHAEGRMPLLDPPDALFALRAEIDVQAAHLDAAALDRDVRSAIDAQHRAFIALCERPARPPRRLIAFDTHPGNFLLCADGRAILVDLEKARYSHPPLDLAHATLYTSTTWDVDARHTLTPGEVRAAYDGWQAACDVGETSRPWFVALRGAMWLWSITWCAQWRVLSPRPARTESDGADWSHAHSSTALVAHVRDRVDTYLSRAGVARVVDELDALRRHFGGV